MQDTNSVEILFCNWPCLEHNIEIKERERRYKCTSKSVITVSYKLRMSINK